MAAYASSDEMLQDKASEEDLTWLVNNPDELLIILQLIY